MSENLINHTELAPEVQTFAALIRRKTGKLEPEEQVSFREAPYIDRKSYDHRYICEVIAGTDPDQPYNINLWDYVSPIWYTKEEYTFEAETGVYMRSGESAEPDFLESVPPYLQELKIRPANGVDLGRIVGILEYLEKETSPQDEKDTSDQNTSSKAKSSPGSKVAKWILGRK